MRLKPNPCGSFVLVVQITLVPGRDDDLITMFEQTPRGSMAGVLRETLRSGINNALPGLPGAANEPEPDFSGTGLDL